MKILTKFQGELLGQYNRIRKQLRIRLKRQMAPVDVIAFIKESFAELTERQSKIIARYIYKAYTSGTAEAKKEVKGIDIAAAAPLPDIGDVGLDLGTVSQKQMNLIFHRNLGVIGDFNENLSKAHQHQYNILLNDNKLINSLNRDGWTPWLEEKWKKRGIAPEIIKLVKGQKTSAQMINILEYNGIQGGMHSNQVAKKLVPYINRFFGPDGIKIDNIGKTVKRLNVDADGNFEWRKQTIKKAYRATPRTYSRMLARNVLREARMDAYYDTLAKSKLVDHYISVAHMDSTTCGICATMHGKTVTKGSGPLYHGNCGCDLRPVWKKNSPLASQNKPDAFFEKQRNTHFLRMSDLKRYNAKMPRGMKLKYASQLPEDAITKVMPGPIKMRAIRHEMLGKPAKIVPVMDITPTDIGKKPSWKFKDTEWKQKAATLYAKTKKDGKEHLILFNEKIHEVIGTATRIKYTAPSGEFSSLHTHPGTWDAPLSGQDIFNFLSTEKEMVAGATTDKHIYLIKKLPDTRIVGINNLFQKQITARFDEERIKKLKLYGKAPYTGEQQTQSCIVACKVLAEKYKFDYKSITL